MQTEQRSHRVRDELSRTLEWLGHDLERVGDQVRRRLAHGLRTLGPDLVRATEVVAGELDERARKIDRSLAREGKRPSEPPAEPSVTVLPPPKPV